MSSKEFSDKCKFYGYYVSPKFFGDPSIDVCVLHWAKRRQNVIIFFITYIINAYNE